MDYNLNLLNNFDYYMIYLSSYISFAPILNYHYRQKLKNFILQSINSTIEEKNLIEKEKEKGEGEGERKKESEGQEKQTEQ